MRIIYGIDSSDDSFLFHKFFNQYGEGYKLTMKHTKCIILNMEYIRRYANDTINCSRNVTNETNVWI